jgi:phenylpyruvate tautomerase PptA (4-oxalocrotonate tautomerase family)
VEGGANTVGGRAFAWVLFTELQAGDWWAGGRTDDTYVAAPGRFLVHVTIPEGYMNAAHKAEVQAWVSEAIMAVAAGAPGTGGWNDQLSTGGSLQVMIDEVTEGNWAVAGQTLGMSRIAASVGLAKDGDRFGWVKAYFGAKARQFADAGYPDDTGGLLAPATDRA